MGAQIRAVVSTFNAVLEVGLDLEAGTVRTAVLESGKGVYFGLTGDGGQGLLVAARNRDPAGRIRSTGIPTDAIYALDPRTGAMEAAIAHPGLADLHQIRRIGDWLCVVQGCGSRLVVFDLRTRGLVRSVDLQRFVPAHLRPGNTDEHPNDPYHFNSLGWVPERDGGALLVLAHNWGESFALELGCVLDRLGPDPVRLIAVHERLGRAAHDVALAGETLFVLDSAGGALIARNSAERRFPLPRHGSPVFARGLAITETHVLVAYGFWSSERFHRIQTPSRLCVYERGETLAPLFDFDLGSYGNPTDLRVISEPDFTDGGAL